MAKVICENQSINIVPENVEEACIVNVKESNEMQLLVESESYISKGMCECFAATDAGVLYFQSEISQITPEQNIYKLELPVSCDFLQRREYTRINIDTRAILKADNVEYEVLVKDISAGGMQVIASKELQIGNKYWVNMMVGQKEINAVYSPIRQEKGQNNEYVISGGFSELSNKSHIAIAQYCFAKQMESINK